MLIRHAGRPDGEQTDIRCDGAVIVEVGPTLRPRHDEEVVDASGGWAMPGLHDHHIHLRSLAATLDSVHVGPPTVRRRTDLADLLREADLRAPSGQWLRGYGYHESVAGSLTRGDLDAMVPDRPLRIQHRSGALWMLNSVACRAVGVESCTLPGVERSPDGTATGRLWRMDEWLGEVLPSTPPDLTTLSRAAAERGVTGFTDATPGMSQSSVDGLAQAVATGDIIQRVHCMADPDIAMPAFSVPTQSASSCAGTDRFSLGPRKILLDDDRLPTLPDLIERIRRSHAVGQPVAVHCVTRLQLIVTMTALDDAGVLDGDRIEHGAIAPTDCFEWLCRRRIIVVTQPNFPLERADQYDTDVPDEDRPDLWRLGSLLDAGIAVAAGTDAPFGRPDPWQAIAAAAQCHSGRDVGETVSTTTALRLFWGAGDQPAAPRRLEVGALADLTITRQTPAELADDPAAAEICATVVGGRVIHRG
ncbi:amidohydrolase [Gordonia sp. OPL2]|nr:amidohydrolase [Gordonia sp. OPL2]